MTKFPALGLVAVLLAGCVSAPTTTPQQTALKSEALGLDNATTPVIAGDWWKAFGDPQLDRIVNDALSAARHSPPPWRASASGAVAIGRDARRYLSAIVARCPRGARAIAWPLHLSAALCRQHGMDRHHRRQSVLVARSFRQACRRGRPARSLSSAAAYDATAARLMLSGTVATAYIQLSRAYALDDAAEATVRQREDVLRLVSGRVKSGLENPAAEKQASAQLELAREDLLLRSGPRCGRASFGRFGRQGGRWLCHRPSDAGRDGACLTANAACRSVSRRADIAGDESACRGGVVGARRGASGLLS